MLHDVHYHGLVHLVAAYDANAGFAKVSIGHRSFLPLFLDALELTLSENGLDPGDVPSDLFELKGIFKLVYSVLEGGTAPA
jgi:hypothetical protein